jgi:hypothetical protein
MRRRTGAILRESRPATIIRSDCRGDPRNTSAPNRAMSYRPQLMAIISIAQQARPNVTGQMAERRAHCTIFSTEVVRTGISISDIFFLLARSSRLATLAPRAVYRLRTPLQSNAPLRHT